MKSLIIGLLLTILNVLVNGFVMLNLTNERLPDTDETYAQMYRIEIVFFQLAGSVLCLVAVDSIERKVSEIECKQLPFLI